MRTDETKNIHNQPFKLNTLNLSEMARHYVNSGWVPMPIPFKSKKSDMKGWPEKKVSDVDLTRDFSGPEKLNIAVNLGENSSNLVDIDIDEHIALKLAQKFLPDTGMIFGRESMPRSHWLYYVPDCGSRVHVPDVIEYRANGCYTVFPPSVHTSGEQIRFDKDDTPARVDRDTLTKAIHKIAAAKVLVENWKPGKRHEIALALSGALCRANWFEDDVEEFISAICMAADDNETSDRTRTVQSTFTAIEQGDIATGFTRLSQLIGQEAAENVSKWLSLNDDRLGHNYRRADNDNILRHSDLGNAKIFADQNRSDVRFCFELGDWLTWSGYHWKIGDRAAVTHAAERTIRGFETELVNVSDLNQRDELRRWIKTSGNKQRVFGMVEMAQHHLKVEKNLLDADPMKLNLQGVTVDLKTGEVRRNQRSDFCTKLAASNYDPRAKCNRFKDFLNEIFDGDQELICYIQRAVGYSLTGANDEECLFVAYGEGANGKSVLLNLLRKFMGDYGCNLPMQSLLAAYAGRGIPNDIAMLDGIRFVTAFEGEEGHKLAASLVKQLTGGDAITARKLHKEYFSFDFRGKIWIATNHKPQIAADDPAMWRRLQIIPFNVVIPPERRDSQLPEKLRAEFPGILNWAIEGAVAWASEGLKPPQAVTDAVSEFRREMDLVGQFYEECIESKPGASVLKAAVYSAYQTWAVRSGVEAVSINKFGSSLKSRGVFDKQKAQARLWLDINLVSNDSGEFD